MFDLSDISVLSTAAIGHNNFKLLMRRYLMLLFTLNCWQGFIESFRVVLKTIKYHPKSTYPANCICHSFVYVIEVLINVLQN